MANIKKKAGHYRPKENKKEKKDDRKVMSFEQLPLEEYEKQDKTAVKITKKKVIIAAAILFALVLSIFLYFGAGTCNSCLSAKGVKNNFTANIIGSDVDAGNFQKLSEGICYVSDTDFVSLDGKGNTLYTTQHGFAHPVMEVKDSRVLAYDLGSTSYAFYNGTGGYTEAESEQKIYLADITSDGDYAFVTEAKGYNAKFSAYSLDNKIKYGYSFAEYYITSMALNSDCTGAVVCGVSTNNGAQESVIYVLDFTKEEPVAKHIVSDFVFDCDYLSGGSVCAIGTSATYVCNSSKFSKIQKISYNGMLLTTYDINSDIGVAAVSLSRSGDGRNCNIEYINTSGKTEKTIETEQAVTSIDTYKDRFILSDSSNLYLYRSNGKFLESYTATDNCKQMRMHSAASMFVLGLDSVYSITF